MTFSAADIFDRAQRVMQDEGAVRWPLAELREWLNDGLREVVLHKPTATSTVAVLTLAAGSLQALPSQYLAFLSPVCNLASASETRVRGRAITPVQREVLDANSPSWHAMTPAAVVKHVIYDQQAPKSFYVYPPSNGAGFMEAIVAAQAPQVARPANPENAAAAEYVAPIAIDDTYENAVLDFVLYRSFAKDAQYTGSAQRATAHYQQFANSLGIKVRVEKFTNPNVNQDGDTAVERKGA